MNAFKVVLIANDHPLPEWVPKKFAEAGITFVSHECYGRKDLEECAADADVLWFMSSRKDLVVEENMNIFEKAGAAIKCGSGTDNIDHAACTKRGIIVAHTPDDPTDPTSDHFIALLCTAIRRTARQDFLVRQGVWKATAALPLARMSGADLGLLGFGRLGRAIVQKLSGFRMNVRVYDPYVDAAVIEGGGGAKVKLEELLKAAQFVLVACPLNDETRGLVGEKELRMMRPDAVLVNGARGEIVDEKALVRALRERWIRAAALDVVANPPLDPSDELLSLENLNITPHLGGYPDAYPDGLFYSSVDVIIGMSRMHLPPWVANKGVVPKWKMTAQTGQSVQP
jgi:phosphoglycerate dehydrogenase-like enzyme